jgi:Alpha/beta hydrolase of unknown function (DUF900)
MKVKLDHDFAVLNLREPIQIGLQNMPLEDQIGEFPLSDDFDQPCCFQFFHVVGEGCGAHAMSFVQDGARHCFAAFADLFKDLIAPRLGKSAGDPGKLPVGYSSMSRRGHPSTIRSIGFAWQVCIDCRRMEPELKKTTTVAIVSIQELAAYREKGHAMNLLRAILKIVFLAAVSVIAGCACNKQYRTSYKPYDLADPDHTKAIIESAPAYKMGFVEFDDQGWYWDPKQCDTVEQMIRNEAGVGDKAHSTPQGIVLVVFVHGWKDNSDFNSFGVQAFRDILTELSALEQTAQTNKIRSARKVIGVYAGWRGLSAAWEPFKELSFWDRKETAHKVGGYGAMTKLFVDLETIQKDNLDRLPKETPRTELIIIGHSLGAAAVYSALAQIITERFIDTVGKSEKPTRLKPLGDQIIFLNPAFEAQRHYDLYQMAVDVQTYPKDQRPVLSVFTSQTDWATHYVFPISQFFSTLFESNRNDEQKKAGRETIGWYETFVNHQLIYSKNNSATNGDERLSSFDIVQTERAKWNPQGLAPQTYYFPNATLKPSSTYKPGNPFWIVSVDPKMMDGHNDIDNCRLVKFLRDYIEFSRVDPHDHSR